MKNLLITLVFALISVVSFSQTEKSFIVEKSQLIKIDTCTYKVFFNERPNLGKSKKQPVYHQFKMIGGIIFAAAGTTDFTNIEKPFNFGQNLLPNVCIITNSTYHNFVYGMANNSIKVVNGYPFGQHGLDIYVAPGLNLNSGIVCIAAGVEKMVKASDGVNFFMFTELGKDIKSVSKLTLSVGFHVNIQGVLIQHKGHEIFAK